MNKNKSPERDLIGQRLGKYRIEALIGQGGMAAVYRGYHPGLQRVVAIKMLRRHLADDEGFRDRFEREAAAAARLRHLNIVQIHDFDVHENMPFMVMELIDGPTLKDVMGKRFSAKGQFDLGELAYIASALCSAIDYAHTQDVVHRDIKPANIMFHRDGQIVLADFGIARIMGTARQTMIGAVSGTPAYMSPEQGRGEAVDGRCDIYSLGIVLYEMVTGRVPFESDTPMGLIVQHIQVLAPTPTRFNPELPLEVAEVILKALSKRPEDRYDRASEFGHALRQAVNMSTDEAMEVALADSDLLTLGGSPISPRTPQLHKRGRTPVLPGDRSTPVRMRAVAPFQVPQITAGFVGRKIAMAELGELLVQKDGLHMCCLTGMGGIGKSALAANLAHQLRKHFVDGILWANAASSEPMAILDSWAYAYDYDFGSLPDLDSRAAALRSLLADKQVLIVLDDVRSAEEVLPLLPGGERCRVLLTTRNTELAFALNAHPYALSPFTLEESLALMDHILGERRIAGESELAAEICELLMHLPLAVEIAAQRLNSRRRWRLGDLAERLRSQGHRLDELRISDREVRASFITSWEELEPSLRQSFSLLAAFEGRRFTVEAFAAVAEVDEFKADDDLYALASLSLIAEEGAAHYRQHPLLADFAHEHLADAEAVYARLSQYYLDLAHRDYDDMLLLEREWDNLLAGLCVAYRQQCWPAVIDYALTLTGVWFGRGYFSEARRAYRWACEAADHEGDKSSQARCLFHWGAACFDQGDNVEAETHLATSARLFQSLGDRKGVGAVHHLLGWIAIERADYEVAGQWLASSRSIREQVGDRAGLGHTLREQARIAYRREAYARAYALAEQALDLHEAVGDMRGLIQSLRLLADITLYGLDDLFKAEALAQRARSLCEATQDRSELAVTLYALSDISRLNGDLPTAREYIQQSLALLRSMGDRKTQAQALYQLSLVEMDLEALTAAETHARQSFVLCRDLGDVWGAVFVQRHLGNLALAMGQDERAREVWLAALNSAPKGHPLRAELETKITPS